MIEFEHLKKCYITTIQVGIASSASYQEVKRGNDVIHKFCENLVERSNCSLQEKQAMKSELEVIKESLSIEIDTFYR